MNLSRLGVFCFLDHLPGSALGPFARTVERLGYSALWFAEGVGRESLSVARLLPATIPSPQGKAGMEFYAVLDEILELLRRLRDRPRLFTSAEEGDRYLQQERDAWDR